MKDFAANSPGCITDLGGNACVGCCACRCEFLQKEPKAGRREPVARILIVDDDADTCDVMRRLFAKWGWESECLTDSSEALPAVRDRRPDVVLLDVMMPGLDGFAVLAEIRGDPSLTRTP